MKLLPLLLSACLGLSACHRTAPPHKAKPPSPEASAPAGKSSLPEFAVNATATHDGEAFWYAVPDQSLPQRRAWAGELTAASDSLPLNTYVRVRRLEGSNQESIIVRITDTGIHHKDGLIDLSRDAADALGMIKIGQARVRVETLALKNATTDKPVDKKDAPTAPKVSELSDQPAAGEQSEKDAANAKAGR